MVNFEKRMINLGETSSKIVRFEVWWFGPTGLVTTLEMAEQIHNALNLDTPFYMVWKATPVAIAENGLYEEIH